MFKYFLLTLFTLSIPHQSAIASCQYPDDPEMQKRKESCTSASQQWNCRVNRCLTTQQAYQTRENFQQCQQLS